MTWAASTVWWVVVGVLVALELATGTFYLLMLGFGAAAGALAAHLGAGVAVQLVTVALAGGGATALWHYKRARRPRSAPAQANPDVNLDIGQNVHVTQWNPDGTAQVAYRGAQWTVIHSGTDTPVPGEFIIVAMQGSRLIVAPRTPH